MASATSLSSLKYSNKDKLKDSIPCRIELIRDLLKDKKLSPLIDLDNTDTEFFLPNSKDENDSGESYDTRVVLKKRYFNFTDIILQIGGKLQYVKSGSTGHVFKGETVDNFGTFEYGVKVVAYPKKDKYGDITDIRRPENAELAMLKLLSYFIIKKQTPHIILPIGTFDANIDIFIDLIKKNVISEDNKKYNEFIEKYEKGEFHDKVSILISEWANRGDLLDFIRKNYQNFTPIHWKVILFQLLSVLAVIQSKYPNFRHNDLKANNILVHKIIKHNDRFTYRVVKNVYKVPNIGYHLKLWDFDFSCIPDIIDNKKVESKWTKKINVTPVQNRYYDLHYFFNTLIKKGFCPEVLTSNKVPDEVKEFIFRVVPEKYQKVDTEYIHERGRILTNDEYTTPDKLLKTDPYFDEFRLENVTSKIPKKIKKQINSDLTKFLKSNSSDDMNMVNLLIGK